MKKVIFFLALFLISSPAFAATKYARNVTGNWASDSSWSTTSGGAADTTAPTSVDTAVIDTNTGTITVNSNSEVATLTFSASKTLAFSAGVSLTTTTFTHANAITITMNTGTLIVLGDLNSAGNIGQYSGSTLYKINGSGNQLINLNTAATRYIENPVEIDSSGGTVTMKSTYDNEIEFRGGFTYTNGTVDWSSNTVEAVWGETQTIIPGGTSNHFYKSTFAGATDTFTISTSDMYVDNVLNFGNGAVVSGTLNGQKIYTALGLNTNGNYNRIFGGTTILEFTGSSSCNWTPQATASTPHFVVGLPVIFNRSGGTLTIDDDIDLSGDVTYTAGTIDWNGQVLNLAGTSSQQVNLSGTTPYQVVINGTDVNLSANLSPADDVTINSGKTLKLGSKTLTLLADFINNGTLTAGTGKITLDGSAATQTFSGNNTTFYDFEYISSEAKTITFTSGKTYTFSHSLLIIGPYGGSAVTINASTPDSVANWDIDGATQQMERLTVADIDASAGDTAHDYKGDISDAENVNWDDSCSVAVIPGTIFSAYAC